MMIDWDINVNINIIKLKEELVEKWNWRFFLLTMIVVDDLCVIGDHWFSCCDEIILND